MWPWEHLAFAYLWYSAWTRFAWGERPTPRAAVAVAAGALGPDLVDKPLAWWLGALPAGRSLAHSLVVVGPLLVALLLVAPRTDEVRAGVGFALATLSHLAGDVLYPLVTKGELAVAFLAWPLVPAPAGSGVTGDPFAHVAALGGDLVALLATPRGALLLGVDALLLGGAVARWLSDGTPGFPLRERVAERRGETGE
jgi:hypothetical protein